MDKKKLVYEIGVEEIPAQYIRTMAESFKKNAEDMFRELRLHYKDLNVFYTPRRFALIVTDLDVKQESETKTVKGPSASVGFEKDGTTPTKALLGFLRKWGKTPEEVTLEGEGDKKYIAVSVTSEGEMTDKLLPERLAALIGAIYSPNPMRWGDYKIKFIRPIRWLLALFGDEVLPVEIECCKATSETWGHRTLADGPAAVSSADDYEETLKKLYVILTEEERKSMIRAQIKALEEEHHFQVELDEDLLDKVANIIEYPTCAVGSFEEKYLRLPECVIKTPAKTQQFYFPVYRDGKITNAFIFVRNGGSDFIENVIKGNERVLRSRLEDAEFFYDNDCKLTLKDLADQLSGVVFVEKAGSYQDKQERVNTIARKLASLVGYEETEKISTAASLLKADLVSQTVREYTEIQGVVGGVFAERDNYPADVCQAISQQYLPNFTGDALPEGKLASIISIADKLDTVMTLCSVGLKPLGSADPYGQRRQILGIFSIALEQGFDVDFDRFISECADLYKDFCAAEGESTEDFVTFLHGFILQRLKVFLHEAKEIPLDDIEKISVDELNITKSMKKAKMIREVGETEWYQQFILIFNRIQKLIKNEKPEAAFSAEYPDAEASAMFKDFAGRREEILGKIEKEDYESAIRDISDCGKSITAFMEENLALCDEKEKRQNRIAFFGDFCNVCGKIIQLNA